MGARVRSAAAALAAGMAAATVGAGSTAAAAVPIVLDAGHDASAWSAFAPEGARASLSRGADGRACLEHDLRGGAGYAVLARELPVDWPERFDLRADIDGAGGPIELQVKLVDASGDNVWWWRTPAFAPAARARELTLRSRRLEFAWGPATDRALRRTQRIEFVAAAPASRDLPPPAGAGRLCVGRLVLVPREPLPAASAEPRTGGRADRIVVDLGGPREFDGVAIDWPTGPPLASRYRLDACDAGARCRPLAVVSPTPGGTTRLLLPDREASRLVLAATAAATRRDVRSRARVRAAAAPPAISVRDRAQWPDANAVLREAGAAAPRGDVPRALGAPPRQNHWTLVGVDGGGPRSGLLDEDGAVEVGRGGFSVEPSVVVDPPGHGEAGSRSVSLSASATVAGPVTWADPALHVTRGLADGGLPPAAVRWRHPAFELEIVAGADGPPDAPVLLSRLALRNAGAAARTFELRLAVRPWQVNPPQQFLATTGGASPIGRLGWDGRALRVDRRPPLVPQPRPDAVGVLAFDAGLALSPLRAAASRHRLDDPRRMASAMLVWRLRLGPGEVRRVGWSASPDTSNDAPLASLPTSTLSTPSPPMSPGRRGAARAGDIGPRPAASLDEIERRLAAVEAQWRDRIAGASSPVVEIGAASARPWTDGLRAALVQMLQSRDGVALQPGTRSYARSWVRDGAMMVASLLRLGQLDAARDFVDWYATKLPPSGRVPCCVDRRGADAVPEHDAHGQFVEAVAAVARHGGGEAFVRRRWPDVVRVVGAIEALLDTEAAAQASDPALAASPQRAAALRGLMPRSISHEGYSDRPAYSYWDDFWTLRGLGAAVELATAVGDGERQARWSARRERFAADLGASVRAAASLHGIDVVAGAADRGDFDPTSTTVALGPGGARAVLPPALLDATFERYAREAAGRASGARTWSEFTPYEWRNVGALLRLDRAADARALAEFLMSHRRPEGWPQWAEVVPADAREPRFVGDLPHAWVASDFVAAALDMLALARDASDGPGAIVLAAGVDPRWLVEGDVVVRGLPTPDGPLGYAIRRRPGGWTVDVDGPAPRSPLRLAWPGDGALPQARRDGRELAWSRRELDVGPTPARIELDAVGARP